MSEDSVEVKDNVSYVETGRDIRRTLMDIMLYIDADTRYATSAALAEMLALLIKRNTK